MPRLPRFKRSPEIPALRLTDRDREILRHVHRHRFLRSDHLANLVAGSRQQTLRRLQRLFHHGYLERPRSQIDYYQSGSRRIAYGLGNKGAAWLKRELSLPYYQLDWKHKNHVGRLFLEHILLVADVMVAIELACRKRPDIKLLLPDEAGLRPFQWKVEIGRRIKCGVIPDQVFGLEFTDALGNKIQSWYLLEADRGTMPVTREDLNQSSFQRKLLAYEATWTQNIHRVKFGWQRFRILTVTSKAERIATMQSAVQGLKRGHGLFLFLDAKQLSQDFFALRWQTYRENEAVSLLD
jgi:DNA-binding Lrp family transcriptional regulator